MPGYSWISDISYYILVTIYRHFLTHTFSWCFSSYNGLSVIPNHHAKCESGYSGHTQDWKHCCSWSSHCALTTHHPVQLPIYTTQDQHTFSLTNRYRWSNYATLQGVHLTFSLSTIQAILSLPSAGKPPHSGMVGTVVVSSTILTFQSRSGKLS